MGLFLIALVAAYLVPSLIAAIRSHPQTGAIFVLNLLLGWTVLGWIASLVWSVTSTQSHVVVIKDGEVIVQKPPSFRDRREADELETINNYRVSIGLQPLERLSDAEIGAPMR